MRPGHFRHRINIEAQQETRDDHGGIARAWIAQATRRASVKPLTGREFFSAQAVNSDVTHEIRMRYYDGLNTSHRLIHDGRTFHIKSVISVDERNRETVVLCAEVV
jgi:SPP1 family predicted phage head-tail adaptor